MKHIEINCETNETEIRDLTKSQLEQQAIDFAKSTTYLAEVAAEIIAISSKKATLLTKLGLTAEEAKLLLSQHNLYR